MVPPIKAWPADRVERKPVASLVPYANNARMHSDAQIAQVARSIEQYGFTVPVLIDDSGGIIAGHCRVLAAKQLGLAEVPVMIASGWSEAERRAYIIIDNKLALNAEWNDAALRVEFAELEATGFDLANLGFEPGELKAIRQDSGVSGLTDPDEIPEALPEPISKPGDIWVLGKHRLCCGDCTNLAIVNEALNGVIPELMLTDPPYGINIVKINSPTDGGGKPVTIIRAHGASPVGGVKNKRGTVGAANWVDANEYLPIHGDDKPFDPSHLIGLADNHILFGGNYFASKLKDGRCWIVWDKNNTGNFADCELAWTDFDKGVKLYRFTWNGLVREGIRAEELSKRIHPTQKPVGLFSSIIEDFSEQNGNIFDPYIGSGTSIIACERTGRCCFGIEIEPAYVDISVQRWQNFTGKKAHREDGKSFEWNGMWRKPFDRPELVHGPKTIPAN